MNKAAYKCLKTNIYSQGEYKIVPIRFEDRFKIMKWRNEQVYHLRQTKMLTKSEQDIYFKNVVTNLFEDFKPNQILFSFLKNDNCIGYGGLVHLNWENKNAEISFIMDTNQELDYFIIYWKNFLKLIEIVAFKELGLHKIYTYAYDLRPNLYTALEDSGFRKEAVLNKHIKIKSNEFIDIIIHSKFSNHG